MSRAPSVKKPYKVYLHGGLDDYLQHLTTLGLYGATASEVIARIVESKLQAMVARGTFEKAAAAKELVSAGKRTSSNNK